MAAAGLQRHEGVCTQVTSLGAATAPLAAKIRELAAALNRLNEALVVEERLEPCGLEREEETVEA